MGILSLNFLYSNGIFDICFYSNGIFNELKDLDDHIDKHFIRNTIVHLNCIHAQSITAKRQIVASQLSVFYVLLIVLLQCCVKIGVHVYRNTCL